MRIFGMLEGYSWLYFVNWKAIEISIKQNKYIPQSEIKW